MNKPICYMLIGLPGSGKSTWAQNKIKEKIYTVISTDNYIDMLAKYENKTYNEVFQTYIKEATSNMNICIKDAVNNKTPIIWDQTNLTVKSRANKIKQLKGYDVIAVVFTVSDKELDRRLNSRPGKTIPFDVLESMKHTIEYPTLEEGFSQIITYNKEIIYHESTTL